MPSTYGTTANLILYARIAKTTHHANTYKAGL